VPPAHPDHRLAYLAGHVLSANGTLPGNRKQNGRLSPAVRIKLLRAQTAAVIHCCSFAFGAARPGATPISPPLNHQGWIDITPYFEAVFGLSSTFSFTI